MADPIMTGREELGFAKLYAQMPGMEVVLGDAYRTRQQAGKDFASIWM